MTSEQTAWKILEGFLSIIEDKRSSLISMRSAGHYMDAELEEHAMNALLDVASGLLSAIEDGEFS